MKNCNNYGGRAKLLTQRGGVPYLSLYQEVLMESKNRWNLKDHQRSNSEVANHEQ